MSDDLEYRTTWDGDYVRSTFGYDRIVERFCDDVISLRAENDRLREQVAGLEALQDEAEAELVRFIYALREISRRLADAFAGDNLFSEARVLVGFIKDTLALGQDSPAVAAHYAALTANPEPTPTEEKNDE
jgi:hypothetical protein